VKTAALFGIVLGGVAVLISPVVLQSGSQDNSWGIPSLPNFGAGLGVLGAGVGVVILSTVLYVVDF
jgi:hypothetical protein